MWRKGKGSKGRVKGNEKGCMKSPSWLKNKRNNPYKVAMGIYV
jgi:hypothetical protein